MAENAFWRRPEWLYPVVVGSIALFSSTFALATLNRVGAATGVALTVLAFRLLCLNVFGAEAEAVQLGYLSHVLLIPPALTLDGWYFFHRYSTDTVFLRFKGHLLAGIIFLLVGLPGINALLMYPRITQATLPTMVGMTLLMSLSMGWAGEHFSQWLGTLAPYATEEHFRNQAQLYLLIGLGFMAVVILSILMTAEPPRS